jgi:hypothetical protein
MGPGATAVRRAQGGSPTQSRTSARQRRRPNSHGRRWPARPAFPSRGPCGPSFPAFPATAYIFVALPTPQMSPKVGQRLVAVPVAVVGVCTRSSRHRSRADQPRESGRHRMNNDRQTSKACWVHALAGSNSASSASPTRQNAGPPPLGCARRWRSVSVPVSLVIHRAPDHAAHALGHVMSRPVGAGGSRCPRSPRSGGAL